MPEQLSEMVQKLPGESLGDFCLHPCVPHQKGNSIGGPPCETKLVNHIIIAQNTMQSFKLSVYTRFLMGGSVWWV